MREHVHMQSAHFLLKIFNIKYMARKGFPHGAGGKEPTFQCR